MSEPKLDRKCQGHHDTVSAINFSPTGRQIASGSMDSTIMIWNSSGEKNQSALSASKKSRAYRYEDHKDAVYDLEFSPNGQLLASCSRDRTIRLWVPNVKGECTAWQAHTGAVRSVSFSPDGHKLLSASDDKSLKFWATHKQKFIRSFRGHQNWVRSAKFSPDGASDVIVSGSDDKTVKLWDQRQANCTHTFYEHGGFVNQVAFHPSGTCIASAGSDAAVRIWDIRTHRLAQYYSIHGTAVNSLAFHPNGQWLMTSGSDGTCKLLDVLEGRTVFTLHGHSGPATACAFSRRGDRIASGSVDESVVIWESNLDAYAVDHEEKKKQEQARKLAEAKKYKDLKVNQKAHANRMSVPLKHKVTKVDANAEPKLRAWIPAHGAGKSHNSPPKKVGGVRASMAAVEPEQLVVQQPPEPAPKRTIRENLARNTEKINKIPQSHEALSEHNEMLTATIGTMEARMGVMENQLQEVLLELRHERARNQLLEAQAADKIMAEAKARAASSEIMNTQQQLVMNAKMASRETPPPGSDDLNLSVAQDQQTKFYETCASEEQLACALERVTMDAGQVESGRVVEPSQRRPSVEVSQEIVAASDERLAHVAFEEEETPTPRDMAPTPLERREIIGASCPPVETVQIFSSSGLSHNSDIVDGSSSSLPTPRLEQSTTIRDTSVADSLATLTKLPKSSSGPAAEGGVPPSMEDQQVKLQHITSTTSLGASSISSSATHYSEAAEETRQQALRSLDELRRSLTEAVTNSISSLNESEPAAPNTDTGCTQN